MDILIKSLQGVKKVFGLKTKTYLLILLVPIICTCSGPKLMLGNQTFEKQIDYSLYSGRHARPISGLMECVILKTVDQGFPLCPRLRPSILQLYPRIHGTEYCPNRVPMLNRCSQIRLSQYRLITHFSSNQYRTEWTGQKPNSHRESPPQSLHVRNLTQTKRSKRSQVLIPQSTGRIQATTRTMVRNSNSSSTTNRVNGKGRTTSSTTGGLRKQH